MSTLLSQEEVDALLSGVGLSQKPSDQVSEISRPTAYVYDFKHPNRLTKDQLRSLRTIHDNFAKLVATYFTAILRSIVDVRLSSIDQVTFREFTLAMSELDCLWVFDLEGCEGRGIIEFSPGLVFMITDKLFGGHGTPYNKARPVSVIEQNVVKRVVQRTLQLWGDSWQKVLPLKTKLLSFETNPQLAQIASMSETVIVIPLEVNLKSEVYPMNICLPFFVMEPMILKLSQHYWMMRSTNKKEREHEKIIKNVVKSTEVPIVVELGQTEVSIGEFLDLDTGDVIVLDQKISEDLAIRIGNTVRFNAKPGVVGKKKAMQITQVIQ